MAQNGQESSVTYEELLDLEREFEDADAEISMLRFTPFPIQIMTIYIHSIYI